MSGIVLSASVRQNLLSLQSTAALLATTQNDLATGNKVNSALDNPTNFFTAQGLNNRASDISNLLDGIGNGVQVLQAANTGITSLQSLVATAKSIANQVLQTPVGYSTKSNVTSAALTGATANNLLGLVRPAPVTGSAVNTTTPRRRRAITTVDHAVGHRGLPRPTTSPAPSPRPTRWSSTAPPSPSPPVRPAPAPSIGIGDTVAHLLSTINVGCRRHRARSPPARSPSHRRRPAALTLSGTALAKLGLATTARRPPRSAARR